MFESKKQKLIRNYFSFIMLSYLAIQNNGEYYIEDFDYTEGVFTYFLF